MYKYLYPNVQESKKSTIYFYSAKSEYNFLLLTQKIYQSTPQLRTQLGALPKRDGLQLNYFLHLLLTHCATRICALQEKELFLRQRKCRFGCEAAIDLLTYSTLFLCFVRQYRIEYKAVTMWYALLQSAVIMSTSMQNTINITPL